MKKDKVKNSPTAKEAQLLKAAETIESFQAGLIVVVALVVFFGILFDVGTIEHRSGYWDGVGAYQKYEQCADGKSYADGQVCWDTYISLNK